MCISITFIIEFLLKAIGLGFLLHKTSYLREGGWNILDFIVVLSSILDFTSLDSGLIRAFRSLRALRPLRSIGTIKSMKKIIRILGLSAGSLLNVGALLLFILVLFGIIGLHSLGDGATFSRCRVTEKPKNSTFWEID